MKNIQDEINILSEDGFQILEWIGKQRIMWNEQKQEIKIKQIVNLNQESVYECLLDVERYGLWNKRIKNLKILKRIQQSNSKDGEEDSMIYEFTLDQQQSFMNFFKKSGTNKYFFIRKVGKLQSSGYLIEDFLIQFEDQFCSEVQSIVTLISQKENVNLQNFLLTQKIKLRSDLKENEIKFYLDWCKNFTDFSDFYYQREEQFMVNLYKKSVGDLKLEFRVEDLSQRDSQEEETIYDFKSFDLQLDQEFILFYEQSQSKGEKSDLEEIKACLEKENIQQRNYKQRCFGEFQTVQSQQNDLIEQQQKQQKQLQDLLEKVQQKRGWCEFVIFDFFEQSDSIFHFQEELFQKNLALEKAYDENNLHYIWKKDLVRDEEKGGLIYINQVMLDQQKKLAKYVLGQIGSNMLKGKSIVNIQLPIYIFENRSNLERHAYSFTLMPIYLDQKSEKKNTFSENLKKSILATLTSAILYIKLDKPITPMTGETFTGCIGGNNIYFEQISFNPPVCYFYFLSEKGNWKAFGNFEMEVSLMFNTCKAHSQGLINYQFFQENNKIQTVQSVFPYVCLDGILYGQRNFYFQGSTWAWDLENKLIAEIQFNQNFEKNGTLFKTKDSFVGGVYSFEEKFAQYFEKQVKNKHKNFEIPNKIKNNWKLIHSIQGVWNQWIDIDGENVWNQEKPLPYLMKKGIYDNVQILPSDSTLRQDLIYFQLNNLEQAQKIKEQLEEEQKNEQNLRKKVSKKK